MYTANPIMLKAGFVPVAYVAEVLNKAVSTVHRMVTDGRVEGTRDGRALYIRVASLEAYFRGEGNTAMADAVKKGLSHVSTAETDAPARQ